jgi:RNA-directed DNA polymerase
MTCFEFEKDARTFEPELKERLSQFKLEVEPPVLCKRDGLKKPARCRFLGILDNLRRRLSGATTLGHKTQGSQMRKKLTALGQRLQSMRSQGTARMREYVIGHVRGHLQCYGISGNTITFAVTCSMSAVCCSSGSFVAANDAVLTGGRFDLWCSAWMPKVGIVHTL